MGRPERVVDVDVGVRREGLREGGVVLLLLGVESEVLEEEDLARPEALDGVLRPDPESVSMRMLAKVFASPSRFERMQKLGRFGQRLFMRDDVITSLPGYLGGWTAIRDVYPIANQTFREWWRQREHKSSTRAESVETGEKS